MIEIRPLGEGGFGVVTLVEDPMSHELIALKSFNKKTTSSNDDITESFIREVEILIELHHPCILEIVGYSLPTTSHPGRIGTKYASKGSLRESLDERRRGNGVSFLDNTGIVLIIAGIVIGMKFIHSRGIIHRDLKPANILIEDNGFVRIGDLGSSRIADSEVTKTKGIGTPIYMAPEMYDGLDYSCSVDVFAFALIMYEIIVGDYVFSPTLNPMMLMKKVSSSERPIFASNIPKVLTSMMSRCWSADANSRDSFQDIARQLTETKFAILPGVDTDKVMNFVGWVSEQE
jgi:serine/threonine protein kinase